MATKPTKLGGGSVCMVSTCTNYSGKVKQEERTDISFHKCLIILFFLCSNKYVLYYYYYQLLLQFSFVSVNSLI